MNNETQEDGGPSKDFLLPVILVSFIVFIFAVLAMYWRKKKCSFFRKKDKKDVYDEELKSLRVTVDTKTEDIHIEPS